ncbi:MAG: hydroxymethylglutaryl-CoA lyase [Hyphomicrobiaceae bacterium]
MERDVFVREVGPRDGLQLVQQFMPTETKLRWIRAEAEAGVIDFEVCSFVPPKVIPQFADAKEVATAAMAIAGIHPMVLVPNLKGAEIGFEMGAPMINCIVSVSRTHNEKNVRRTREQSIAGFHEIVARRNGTEAYQGTRIGCGLPTALGCTLEGDVPEAETLSVVEEILAAGPDEITIPDTVGYASPTQVRSLFEKTIALCDDVPVVAHFHDTRGLGLANVYAALEAGCRRFDGSLAGLGGCPFAPGATGNIVTEDLVFLLEAEGLKTGINVMALREARDVLLGALPDEPAHGTIIKAGLPKGFTPASAPIAAE